MAQINLTLNTAAIIQAFALGRMGCGTDKCLILAPGIHRRGFVYNFYLN